jgi:hypothetical protein
MICPIPNAVGHGKGAIASTCYDDPKKSTGKRKPKALDNNDFAKEPVTFPKGIAKDWMQAP